MSKKKLAFAFFYLFSFVFSLMPAHDTLHKAGLLSPLFKHLLAGALAGTIGICLDTGPSSQLTADSRHSYGGLHEPTGC